MAHWVWLLEEFDRASGKFRSRHRLADLSDEEARSLVAPAELGNADLFDVPDSALAQLSTKYGLNLDPKKFEYLLGRGSLDSSAPDLDSNLS